MCPHVSLATFGTQILLIYSRILLLQHVHFFAKNQDLTNLQDRLGAALQNCGTAQGFCKIAARLRAPPNCQALYSSTLKAVVPVLLGLVHVARPSTFISSTEQLYISI